MTKQLSPELHARLVTCIIKGSGPERVNGTSSKQFTVIGILPDGFVMRSRGFILHMHLNPRPEGAQTHYTFWFNTRWYAVYDECKCADD